MLQTLSRRETVWRWNNLDQNYKYETVTWKKSNVRNTLWGIANATCEVSVSCVNVKMNNKNLSQSDV